MKVIFTNGCFDILHRGHIELFQYCRSLGSRVVVGLNSDASVRKIKGEARPINCQEDRKLMLEALRFVDEVLIFDDDTPYNLIKAISPDIIVKGGDYNEKDIVGNDLCQVRVFKYVEGYSTTQKIQDISNR